MAWTTPGIDFLARNLVVPTAINFGISTLAFRFLHVAAPRWVLVIISILGVPGRAVASVLYKEWVDSNEAKARGARLAPRLKGKSIGNADQLTWLMKCWKDGYPGDGFREIVDELGTVLNLRIMFANTLFTIEPEHIKLILSTDFDNYVKGKSFSSGRGAWERSHFAMGGVLGSGVFNTDGDLWKFHRSMTRPFFTRDRIRDFERFDRHTHNAISLLKQRMKTGHAIDFQDIMQRLTLDSSTEILFGACVNSLQISDEDLALPFNHPGYSTAKTNKAAHSFSDAFVNAQLVIAGRERNGWIWPLLEMWGDQVKEPMSVVNRYLEPIIRGAVEKNAARIREGGVDTKEGEIEEDETLLDHLVRMTSDPQLLKDETLNILIAGRDTMASVLTSMVYLLSLHPHILARLREEVLEKVGPSRRPTYADVKDMKFLRAVINETLRLLPPVPIDVRECVRGAIWPSPDPKEKPIYVPAGAATPYWTVMMHTRKDLWGPDADEFDPDRFLDERLKKYLVPNPFIFLPFNAGPRICLGQQFAYNEMSFVMIRLLQSFSSFTLDEEAFPPSARVPADWGKAQGRKAKERFRPKVVLTMSSEGGMWLKGSPVDES